ncbi:MAG: glycosyltransferase family 2 protein [Deltaproteobacteria bacterium]|nr:glycosyltransferase family 2 protein [Deltaproteobacteria bacterium]
MNISVVVPVKNEADNVSPLVEEIRQALAGMSYEIIYVDDGSSDGTWPVLRTLMATIPELCVLRHRVSCGQSTAVLTGVRHARAPLIVTLDGDGQNDPADIPGMLQIWHREESSGGMPIGCIAGWRTKRNDNRLRKISSRVANAVRSRLLGDLTPDTGCGLKLFSRDTFMRLPYFDHMHRFLPALFMREGTRVVSVPVNHRPRERGVSKYGLHNRLWVGLVDIAGVMWLLRRAKNPEIVKD